MKFKPIFVNECPNLVEFRVNYLPKDHIEKRVKRPRKKHSVVINGIKRAYRFHQRYLAQIWAFLFLAVVFLNFFWLQPISWSTFSAIFKSEYSKTAAFISVIVFGFLFFVIVEVVLGRLTYFGRINTFSRGEQKVSWYEWLKLLSVSFFIRSITPFSIGSEPYVIWWLRKRGIPLKQGSAIVSALTISWFIAQGVITWPSFIYLHIRGEWNTKENETSYYWMIAAGLIVDLISGAFVFTISYSKKVHYGFALIKYHWNNLFRIQNLVTKEFLRQKYIENTAFKSNFKRVFFNITTVKTVLVLTAQNLLLYSLYALLVLAINSQSGFKAFMDNFHIINISTTSNNFVPTPGSEGSIQFTIDKMHNLISKVQESQTQDNNGKNAEVIFLWRWFQKYQPVLLSVFFFVFIYIERLVARRSNKHRPNKNIYPGSASLYTANDSLIQFH
ncbi:putative integral membrane protein [Candidatus Mycoplasma haematolamae str. Purdue]|uniref:Putative integral membrane protein n=1 Tax=Mycoplasma haematolamae (strain Purdue) TaxID=1212765 RepID=I7CK87_MYCHA|nr:lysylphosphatidylglycerol synthase domain-containing protein [Candidatus Mycoplasma haematolamae]AFO52304.1 putative integral membrane protein [Candidatus Mycoplasma haematolamae str. Purdue]